ncbi:MAG: HlyD family efflux transporter periplasmic adaptor subunit [Bacteroidales bacterium]
MPDEKLPGRIELHERETEEMLGRVPGWITRNGMILFGFLIVLLLVASWVYRTPDIKEARIVVTSVNPPAELEARSSGKIVNLLVSDNQRVERGQVLAVLENPASYADVSQLKSALTFLDTMALADIEEEIPELQDVQLGTIQSSYGLFLKAYRETIEFKRLNYHRRRIELLRDEMGKQREYSRSLNERVRIAEEEYNLSFRQYNRNSSLYEQSVVSEADLENARSEMLAKRNKWQEYVSTVAQNNIEIGRIGEQIVELELKAQEERSRYVHTLEEAYTNLKASLATWEQTFLLVAPVSGSVTFTHFWSENQNVEAGEKVLTIIPAESGSMVGKISLPLNGAGKVTEGKEVFIRFDNYPYLEFGMVKGVVRNKSRVSDDDFYMVEVDLPAGLTSLYGEEIPFSQNMQGDAEILTDKMRLLHRVMNPLKSALSRQRGM